MNLKRILFIALICILFQSSSFGQNERRLQIWNKNEVEIQPWKNISLSVAEKIHYSPDHNALDLKYGELFAFHSPLSWLEYGAGFRVSYSNLYVGWLQENRTMAVIDFKTRAKSIGIKFSNRFEYRNYKTNLDHFRYKQQTTLNFPQLTDWGMQFFIFEETFHKFNDAGFHLFRVSGGINGIQKKHFKLKLYYALEKYKVLKSWYTTDIIGTNLSFIL